MFAASPSFLQIIRSDDDLIKKTILGTMVKFIETLLESVGKLTSSTLFQLDVFFWNSTQNQIKVNEINDEDDDDDLW